MKKKQPQQPSVKTQMQNAMEKAFRKSVEEGTAADKDAIKAALFGRKPGIQPAPKAGRLPVDKIQRAVDSVSKKK